jgi:hypothetical protein
MRYEITNENVVLIFNDGDTVPFLSQPDYPNFDKWTKAEAKVWAETYIASLDESELFYAPEGKGLARKAKPTPEEIAAWEAERANEHTQIG